MIRTLILTAAVMTGLSTSTSTVQAGGGFGIGFGGRGVGVYVGRGGGWGGYYGPSGYYGPGYSGGPRVYTGSGYYGPSYYVPGTVSSESTVVTPSVPAPRFDGEEIVLVNPATNMDSVEYTLNGERFVMRPGQSHRFTRDRDWVIEFDRGNGSNFARYSLNSSTYKFRTASNGWELFEQATSRPDPRGLPLWPAAPRPARPASPPQPTDDVLAPIPEAATPKP